MRALGGSLLIHFCCRRKSVVNFHKKTLTIYIHIFVFDADKLTTNIKNFMYMPLVSKKQGHLPALLF